MASSKKNNNTKKSNNKSINKNNNKQKNEIKVKEETKKEENKLIKEEEVNKENIKEDVILEEKQEEFAKILDDDEKYEFEFKDNFLINFTSLFIVLFLIEIIFKLISGFSILSYATLRIILSDIIISLIISFLSTLTKRRWLKNTILIIFIFLYSIYSWLQLGFINFLGVYISFHTSSQFGAVTDYIYDFLASIKLSYYLIFIPFILYIVYLIIIRKKIYEKIKINLKSLFILFTVIICSSLYYVTLRIPFMQEALQVKSNRELFKNPDVPTIAVNQFGPVVFGVLDFKTFIFPIDDSSEVFKAENVVTKPVSREVSDALEEIASLETNKKYMSLNNYFASRGVTDYNDYTGLFEGKNVIVVLMESVNNAIINEKYFPNYYNIYTNGWSFANNYSPRNSCATGNNEFSAMTSLYSIYNTCTSNVYKNNTYFEAIFNLFNNKGYTTTSMHDFIEWYYYRKTIHPNMGSQKYYNASSLGIETAGYYGEWPSDEDLFSKGLDIILNNESDKPFMTWFTTVTSHQPYSVSSTYGDLYKDYFMDEGYTEYNSRYLSKLKVLDNALGIMIDKLKAAGKLDDTVIVLLADHYPYGLSKNNVSQLLDLPVNELNDYEIERTPFVIYNPSMTPKVYTQYNSYINLVPTLANLMNLEYDPRLYMGTDLFSDDYVSRVVFADGSWKNEDAYYNASSSKITYYTDKEYTTDEIIAINNEIKLKMDMSTNAIKNDYFTYLDKKINEYNLEHQEVNDDENLTDQEE